MKAFHHYLLFSSLNLGLSRHATLASAVPLTSTKKSTKLSPSRRTTTVTTKGGDALKEQWKLWPYFNESIRWHSDWIRWNASTTLINERFPATRYFEAHDGHYTLQYNTYFYDDERGMVSLPPFKLDKLDPAQSTPYGATYPIIPVSRLLTFPDRSAAWIMKEFRGGARSGFELILSDGGFLRASVGIVYDETGQLTQVSSIREDSRGFNGTYWSTAQDTAILTKFTDRNGKENALKDFWPTISSDKTSTITSFKISVPGPFQNATEGRDYADLESLKFNPNILQEQDVVFELPDGFVLVCPSQLPAGEPTNSTTNTASGDFVFAAGWKKDDGSWTSSMEARYTNFSMHELVYTTFKDDNSTNSSDDTGNGTNNSDDTSAATRIDYYFGSLAAVLIMTMVAFG